eukprot:6439925-Prorocentrum_lima.AAC.1
MQGRSEEAEAVMPELGEVEIAGLQEVKPGGEEPLWRTWHWAEDGRTALSLAGWAAAGVTRVWWGRCWVAAQLGEGGGALE